MPDDGKPQSPHPARAETEDWRDLAAQAAKETDPTKLSLLVRELCEKIEQRAAARQAIEPPKPAQEIEAPLDSERRKA